MGKPKRVRFLDDETDDFLRNNHSNPEVAVEPRIIDAPKTSEYAFFKKIKKDVNKASKSAGQPVGGESLSYTSKSRYPLTKFSSPAEKERTDNHFSFVSPPSVAPTKSATERHTGVELDKINRSNLSCMSGDVTPVDHIKSQLFSPTDSASANEGNQYFGKGVFADKRRKLQQQAVDTLFPEFGEGYSKGYHIVSKLLNRLLPRSCENDDTELVERKMDATENRSTLPTSYRLQKDDHLVHKKTSMDLKNESFFDNITPTHFHGITKKNLALGREDSLAIFDTGYNFLDYVADHQFVRGYQKRNSSFWFPYETMSAKAFHIEELDEYSDPSKARKREPNNFLLEWDSDWAKENNDLHHPAHDVEDYTCSTLRTSRICREEQSIGDSLDDITLPSFPRICPNYELLPYYQPNRFDAWNARRLLEYDNEEGLEPKRSVTQNCTLAEDSSNPNVLECDSDSPNPYYQDNPCSIISVFSERPQHDVKPLILSGGLDIDMAWKCLSLSNTPPAGRQLSAYYSSYFPPRGELSTSLTDGEFDIGLQTSSSRKTYVPSSEDAFTHQDCSDTNILDRTLNCHLLIDSSNYDEPYIHKEDYR